MKKIKPIYIAVFAILTTAVALWCGINVISGIIFSVSENASGLALYYNDIATGIICFICGLNALCSIILGVALIYRKTNPVLPITLFVLDAISLIVVLAAILI